MLSFRRVSERDSSHESRVATLLTALEESASSLGPRRFVGIHSSHPQETDLESAREGLFRLGDGLRELRPPVDWALAPYAEGDEYAFLINCFIFADPVLAAEATDEIRAPLLPALMVLFEDWIEQNPQLDPVHPHKYAWYDHSAAARLVNLAHVLREGTRLGVLTPEQKELLAGSVIEHADYLLAEENYKGGHNHGMFSDAALRLAAETLPFAPESAEWSSVATTRFRQTVENTIETTEGVHLEHSPFYQLVVRGALERFGPSGLLPEDELHALMERMDEATAWMTAPDGTLPPIGDSPAGVKPTNAVQEAAARGTGLRAFPRSGYCMVRDGDSYLFVTAAFHSEGHKHSDDLSFCLYEGRRPFVGDSGNPGYDYASAARRYCVSPAAHSGIEVDGYSWIRDPRGGAGSGLVGAGTFGDTHAILAENPRIAPDDRVARRLFLYRPGRSLAVIDEISALDDEVVERHLQLSPELSATVLSERGGGDRT